MEIDLQDYYSGGYFITKYIKRPEVFPKLLPENIVSLSNCICDFFPDAWAYTWTHSSEKQIAENAEKFGIDKSEIKEVIDYITSISQDDLGIWNVYNKIDTAVKLRNKFLKKADKLAILGAGLHKSYEDEFIKHTTPPISPPGYAPNGESGVHKNIKTQKILEKGKVLGYELLSTRDWSFPLEDSWLCYNMVPEIQEKLGIKPNKEGFIDCYDDALIVADYMSKDKPESILWMPWLVIEYLK
jgi:hypothetical protein